MSRVSRTQGPPCLDAQSPSNGQAGELQRIVGSIGLKVFNITDHFNPRDYQGNVASSDFGGFNNSVGRTFRGKWIFEF